MPKNRLLLLTLLLVACSKPVPPPPEAIRPVKTLTISTQSSQSGTILAGEVKTRYESPLAFRVSGKIIERRINLGDHVKRGQVLARLETNDLQLAANADAANVAGAKSDLALAEAELTRYRSLRDKNFVSAAVLDQKKTTVDSTRARLNALEASYTERHRQVGYTSLVADSEGVITWLDLNIGQVVGSGQALLKVAHSGEQEVEIHVPESLRDQLKPESIFSVSFNAMPDKIYPAHLREIAAAADPSTRTFAVRLSLKPDSSIQLGMSASITLQQVPSSVIRLPLAALVSRDGKTYVWKVEKEHVHAITINSNATQGDQILVSSGLNVGDDIVVAGAHLLREGQQVRPMKVTETAVGSPS